ncbi:ATP-binding cassette domain-containing protein [Paenibacillus sp.]|uniref:ABC transporter ATP-binding protein n=1 Tax=Paenibacillus sp. TaxID=58172 RepID=UPI0028110EC8|nr:ATP-binding cassette domain-containing protein [Paenibacillus sp.]
MIRLSNVSFIREGRSILTDISWQVEKGQHWALLGRNGSGKTTLLEIISGYQFPSTGAVEVLGARYGQVDLREQRKRLGYISQSLFEKLTPRDPLWEAVATGAYAHLRFYEKIDPEVRDRAMARLQQFGLERLADNPIGTLSQGERKKAMLARALMGEPELIVLDEPCSGLDLYQRENYLEVVEQISKEAALLYVTHHMEEIVPALTHVALLREGKLTAAGPKRDVLTATLIEEAYDVQVTLDWEEERPWIRVKRT